MIGAGTLAMPAAHADPLDPIRAAANNARSQTSCAALNYSRDLEGQAQHEAANAHPGVPPFGQYKGTFIVLKAHGDHEDVQIRRVIDDPVSKTAFSDCDYKDFGVGFESDLIGGDSFDVVTIVLGKPAPAPAPPPEPVPDPAPAPAPAAAPAPADPAKVAPTNAVHLSFDRDLVTWTANVTNSADLAGKCTYKATNPLLPGVNKSFTIDPNGTASFPVLAPPALSTYHVVVSCHGTFNGKDVEFGHEEQDVP